MTEALVAYQPQELALPDRSYLERELRAVREFQSLAQQLLIRGQDFGVIPGTDKPTLLKPGAEKIAKLLGLADQYEIVEKTEDWDRPLFRYLVKCRLVSVRTGVTVSESMGECNSMEARYRWRNAQRCCPKCGQETIFQSKPPKPGFYCWSKRGGCGAQFRDNDQAITSQKAGKVPNEDIYSLVNTIVKMAQKRALVGASLSAGRLSEVFTQDMEDIAASKTRAVEADFMEMPPDDEPIVFDAPPVDPELATPNQLKAVFASAREHGWSNDDLRGHIHTTYVVMSSKDLTKAQASELLAYIAAGNKPAVVPQG